MSSKDQRWIRTIPSPPTLNWACNHIEPHPSNSYGAHSQFKRPYKAQEQSGANLITCKFKQYYRFQEPVVMSYKLLSSSRWDPYLLSLKWNCTPDNTQPSPFLLLHFHVDRLIDAAEQHGWPAAKSSVSLDALRDSCTLAVEQAHSEASEPPRSLKVVSPVPVIL
jgi:hypothetical protein